MEIEKVACIGSGTIGSSWAALFSIGGRKVNLFDVEKEALERAHENINSELEFLSERGLLNRSVEEIMGKINLVEDMEEALEEVDYVQESVPERYDAKRSVFREMDGQLPKEVILASSTSGLLMTEIQKATENPERCITAHPWNPPLLIPLVEIVPGEETAKETVEKTVELMEELGKSPVRVRKEVPGFIGNRLQMAVWREACDLVDKGVCTVEEVDKALSAGPGIRWAFMGPHFTLHLGGGEGGLEHWVDQFAGELPKWLEDMADWEQLPHTAAKSVLEGMEGHEMLEGRDYKELVNWRNDKLVGLLKVIYGGNPFESDRRKDLEDENE